MSDRPTNTNIMAPPEQLLATAPMYGGWAQMFEPKSWKLGERLTIDIYKHVVGPGKVIPAHLRKLDWKAYSD